MEKDRKKKITKGKRKVTNDISFEEKSKSRKLSKVTNLSFHQDQDPKLLLSIYNYGHFPAKTYEFNNIDNNGNETNIQKDNYFEIITKQKEEMKTFDKEINEQISITPQVLDFLNELYNNIIKEKEKIMSRIAEKGDDEIFIENFQNELNIIGKEKEKYETQRDNHKKRYENSSENQSNEILFCLKKIEEEKNILSDKQNSNNECRNKIPDIINKIQIKEQELNEEKIKKEKQIELRNTLKEQYNNINNIAINDNKFCHDNFYSLLTFFPYYKNVAFISNDKIDKMDIDDNKIIEEKEEKKFDENKIITEEEINNDIEKENIKNIQYLLNQKENINNNNISFKILKDRKTLQINPKEKYKFKKIFSIINNNYIAEPWNSIKYNSFKLSTINSYFNEFNMTAISNNYFIIYFLQNIDKISINNELYKLYLQIKNNEYIDKKIVIKISAITESNYINLQNINHESKIKNQLISLKNSGIHTIYGFLYEFTKTNRLNKKNIFRIYNFDYSYPYAIEMMSNISKYYAKKKRKKTGIYKKVIRQGGQAKQKKRQADKSANHNNNNNNNNNNVNKGKVKPNNNNNIKKININKPQFKKTTSTVIGNSKNLKKNKSFIGKIQTNNNNIKPKNNINNNNNINVNKKINISFIEDNKKILKKSGSQNQTQKKEKNNNINLNDNNNIKVEKIGEKSKSITPRKNNSANKSGVNKIKNASLVFNDLKLIKPEHTLVIHDINSDFVNTKEFKQVAKACGLLNNSEK